MGSAHNPRQLPVFLMVEVRCHSVGFLRSQEL